MPNKLTREPHPEYGDPPCPASLVVTITGPVADPTIVVWIDSGAASALRQDDDLRAGVLEAVKRELDETGRVA